MIPTDGLFIICRSVFSFKHYRATFVLTCVFLHIALPLLAGDVFASSRFLGMAKLERIEPVDSELSCRGEIAVTASMSSTIEEAVEYIAILTVNGGSYPTFTTLLLPGDIAVTQTFSWHLTLKGSTASVRFRLIAIGKSTKNGYEICDVSKEYALVKPYRSKPTRRGC